MPLIRTLSRRHRREIEKIRGSRFFATAAPTAGRDAADAFVDSLREEFPGATHHCWAHRMASDPDAMRFSDDGEPSGTAGRPILREIAGRDLVDVTVVVTRYYGGTKLGTGGLVRAYSAAAAAVLDDAPIVERPVVETLEVGFAYEHTGPVQGILAAHRLEPVAAEYGAEVRLELAVPVEDADSVRRELADATHGRVSFGSGDG